MAWKIVGGGRVCMIGVCLCVSVCVCVHSETLWVTLDFLLFEVDNQIWKSEKAETTFVRYSYFALLTEAIKVTAQWLYFNR